MNGKLRWIISGIAIGMFISGLISSLGLMEPHLTDDILYNTLTMFGASGVLLIVKTILDYWWDI